MNAIPVADINYLAQQSSSKISMILSGMTALMNDTDNKVETMQSQNWFQRMVKTVTGKNKLTKSEIQQNHDKLNAYMSEAVAELYNRDCIDHNVMMSLGTQLNELYMDHLQLKQMLGAFVSRLNEKIESVDNFHMLTEEINIGIYSKYAPIVALCKIISQYDSRLIGDARKLNIVKGCLEKQNILNDKEMPLTDYLMDIIEMPMEEVGQAHLELGTIRDNFMAGIMLGTMENYHFLPDIARKMKNKNVIIQEVITRERLDASVKLSLSEIYDSLIDSKVDVMNNRLVSIDSNSFETDFIKDEQEEGYSETTKESCAYDSCIEDGISEACADKINIHEGYIVLDDYLVYREYDNKIFAVNKITGDESLVISLDEYAECIMCGEGQNIYLAINRSEEDEEGLYRVNIDKKQKIKLNDICGEITRMQCNSKYLVYQIVNDNETSIKYNHINEINTPPSYRIVNFALAGESIFCLEVLEDDAFDELLDGDDDLDISFGDDFIISEYNLKNETRRKLKVNEIRNLTGSFDDGETFEFASFITYFKNEECIGLCTKNSYEETKCAGLNNMYLFYVGDSTDFDGCVKYIRIDLDNPCAVDEMQFPCEEKVKCFCMHDWIYYITPNGTIGRYNVISLEKEIIEEDIADLINLDATCDEVFKLRVLWGRLQPQVVGKWLYYNKAAERFDTEICKIELSK